MKQRVRLFRVGRMQVVRIPHCMELPGTHATITRDGDRLIIEPVPKRSLFDVLASLPSFDEEDGLDPVADLPLKPVEF
ncbi:MULTISPECIES: antitoxin [Methylobacterium]|uniref:AbrB/MazE/SpoVT family DNA-binding domain-containing protein n=1 Tax=Methylobacterium thuringiense TaxID=1003091 RepID=A0ABQ4TS38_9HYPH|nr:MULTISPECIES: AbrB/MazE/SpoVT family DNA-binding domain-containing protein [Methylobacterium]TXN20157.1 AbrB/MazE/SpoVT family DNA-binding domain-containing protein [Methylobacterium sp. WL9]GJE57527.1 hypothetical protein EKPJFOCH_4044 [Methylobacterium thuringiense]